MQVRKSQYEVPAVSKMIRLLDAIAHSGKPQRLADLARETGVSKATAFTILQTLTAAGYAEKRGENLFWLGPRLVSLGTTAAAGLVPMERAQPVLAALADETGMTAHLAIRDGADVVYLTKVDGPGFVRFGTFPGYRATLHCTGVGKALLAGLNAGEVRELYAQHPLQIRTHRSIGDVEALLADLDLACKRGFAVDDEEDEVGVRCIGSPVRDWSGEVRYATSVTAIVHDLPDHLIPLVGRRVAVAASDLSARLGYVPPEAVDADLGPAAEIPPANQSL